MTQLQHLYLQGSNFSQTVPPQIGNLTNLKTLHLSDNFDSFGTVPLTLWSLTNLKTLGLSFNLANNSLSGEIPRTLGSISNLRTLHLGNNNFSGELPSTLKNCKFLQLIDIGDNMLTGDIPTWIREYHENMVYIIFRNNRFHGSIPQQICYVSQIQVLDFSGNNISGKNPPCFDNFSYLVGKNLTTDAAGWPSFGTGDMYINRIFGFLDYVIVPWKRKESEYRNTNLKLLKLIDLSRNRLVGDIPNSLSSLSGLVSLNLSGNRLTGNINPDIGEMEMLDSLDLSSNKLSGAIPISMAKLHYLSVVDLANNNLSGKIPLSTQLQSFPASAYAGNPELCGLPLQLCPGDGPDVSINNEAGAVDDDAGLLSLLFFWKEVVVSMILGFIVGFWGVVGSLIAKESWRKAFYNFWKDVGDWFWARATIFWRKLRRRT